MREKLIQAIRHNNIAEVENLITQLDLNELTRVDDNGNTALHYAASSGYEKICELLINTDSKLIRIADKKGNTALHYAASNGHEKICELLVNTDFRVVDDIDNKGNTVLHFAAVNGYEKICNLFIKKNSELVNIVDDNGYTPLHLVANGESESLTYGSIRLPRKLLLPKWQYISHNVHVVLRGTVSNKQEEIYKLLIKESPELLNTLDKNGNTLLHLAITDKQEKICELLIKESPQLLNIANNDGYTVLHYAVSSGLEKTCGLLINERPQLLDIVDKKGYTPLHLAASKKIEQISELLINKNPKFSDVIDDNSYTELHYAARNGIVKACELLIKAGFNILDVVDNDGYTELHHAAKNGNFKVCELLIAKKPQLLNIVDKNGYTPLHVAVEKRREEICELLMNKNPKFSDVIDDNSYIELHYAARNGSVKACELLIKADFNILATDIDGYTELHHAAKNGNFKACELLIAKKPQLLNIADKNGYTPLHVAVKNRQKEICELLIKEKYDLVNIVNNYGTTALDLAVTIEVKSNDLKICELLVKKGPQLLDKVNSNGATPLHLAVLDKMLINHWTSLRVCKLLINKKPELVNAVDNSGSTALHYAAKVWRGEDICKLLIENDPQLIDITDNKGYTSLHLAASWGNEKICELLIKTGPHLLDKVTNEGYTPLHLTASSGYEKICELLIREKPQLLNAIDNNGKTALDMAKSKKYNKVIELITTKLMQIQQEELEARKQAELLAKQQQEQFDKLLSAIQDNKLEDAKVLIQNLNPQIFSKAIDNEGNTILHLTAQKNITELYESLIKAAPELAEATNTKNETASEILKQTQQQQQQMEEIMIQQQNDLQKIYKLITEGNAKITPEEKGILVFGKTGAGKSTLTYYLAGEKLKVNNTGMFKGTLENTKDIVDNIKINHNLDSETKIPGKYKVDGTTIIDLPGFEDTGGATQEIPNAFYIKRLFDVTKQVKFILAIEESSLRMKGELLNIVRQFAKTFTEIEPIKKSLSVVITKASDDISEDYVKEIFKLALDSGRNNQEKNPFVLDLLKFLGESSDIHFFYRPNLSDFEVENKNFLSQIESNPPLYLDLSAHPDLANMVISNKSKEYVEDLLKTTYNNLENLLKTFVNALKKAVNPHSIFEEDYNKIEVLLPTTPIKYEDSTESVKRFFPELEQIKKLQELFKKPIDEQNSVQNIFSTVLTIFRDHAANNDPQILKQLKELIQKYKHVLEQQLVCNKFLSDVCNKSVNYNFIKQAVEECKEILVDSLEKAIKSLKVALGEDSLERYKEALEYLKPYENDEEVKKEIATAYNKIGCIFDRQGNYKEAAINYVKALESNPELPEIYKRLGEIFFENKQYIAASKCFKAVGALDEMEECLKKLIESNPNDPNARKDSGDYNLHLGYKPQATKDYIIAFHNSFNDIELHSILEEKLNDIKAEKLKLHAKFNTFMVSKKNYYDNQVTLKELEEAISKIGKPSLISQVMNKIEAIKQLALNTSDSELINFYKELDKMLIVLTPNSATEQTNPVNTACNDNHNDDVNIAGEALHSQGG